MKSEGSRSLLILGCSLAKKEEAGPAIEVYDGPIFRTVRRRLPEIDWPLDVWIISAKHGVLRQTDWIANYDEVLLTTANSGFREKTEHQLADMLPSALNRVLILAPKRYIAQIPLELISDRSEKFEVFSDRLGRCQARLLEWLGIDNIRKAHVPISLGPLGKFSKPIDKIFIHEAAQKLAEKCSSASQVIQWYALIEDQRIPAKKLTSVLTGVPVSSFDTCHALALLHRNAIKTVKVRTR
jgi:hypothetical protein